jgi:transcriptional regulator with XRE-family HTH domain
MTDNGSVGRTHAKPGAVLKRLRAQRGWTLAEVSQRTGLAVSTLSKAENDKIALTFDKLVQISEGLQIDLTQLFGAASADSSPRADGGMRRSVARSGEGRAIETDKGNYLYVAPELLNKRFIPIIGEVFAKDIAEYSELSRHQGEEYVYVLEGTLELHTEMYTPVRLERGDSVYFDSGMGHAYVAVGELPCRILSMCATSESQLVSALQGVSQQGEKSELESLAGGLRVSRSGSGRPARKAKGGTAGAARVKRANGRNSNS